MSDREHLGHRVERALGNEAVWAEPPPDVESKVMASIVIDDLRPDGRLHVSLMRWRALAIAAGTAVVVLGLVLFSSPEQPILDGTSFAVSGPSQVSGTATVGPAEAGWWLHLAVNGMEPAPEGSYYEGWVSDGIDVVSIGTFHMRDGDYVALWSGVPFGDYPNLAVTLQEVGGEPGPSGEVVLTGRLDA